MDDRSKSVSYGIKQDEGYYGHKNKGVNRTILDEKIGLDISLIEPVNLSIYRSKMSYGTLPAINRSRQNNIDNRQQWMTVPSSSKIESTMYKESMKIQKQKLLMKNMFRNRVEQDRKMHEMKVKRKEKALKHDNAMKQNEYDQQVLANKRETKKT
jgi:hypothetical protein